MKLGVVLASAVVAVALVTVVIVAGDNDTRCRYRVGGGPASVELPCGLDRGSLRSYVAQHPELVSPRIPALAPN
jgi:hypothetical protein